MVSASTNGEFQNNDRYFLWCPCLPVLPLFCIWTSRLCTFLCCYNCITILPFICFFFDMSMLGLQIHVCNLDVPSTALPGKVPHLHDSWSTPKVRYFKKEKSNTGIYFIIYRATRIICRDYWLSTHSCLLAKHFHKDSVSTFLRPEQWLLTARGPMAVPPIVLLQWLACAQKMKLTTLGRVKRTTCAARVSATASDCDVNTVHARHKYIDRKSVV